MINIGTLRLVWALLDAPERQNLRIVVAIVIIAAGAAVGMLLSITPFLTVLSNPQVIHDDRTLSWLYQLGNFNSDYDFLIALGVSSIAIIVLANLLQLLKIYAIGRFVSTRTYSISTRLLEKYLRQPYEFFLNKNTGELGKQILSESQQVVDLAIKPAIDGFAALVTLLFIAVMLLYLEPVIMFSAFGIIVVLYGVIFYFTRTLSNRLGEVRKDANAASFKIANEAMTGIKELKVLGRERHYRDLFARPALQKAHSLRQIYLITQSPQYLIHTIMFGGVIVLCLVLMIRTGTLDGSGLAEILPTLGLLAFAGQRMAPELSTLFRSSSMLAYAGPAVETVHRDLILESTGEPLPHRAPEALRLRERLCFEGVFLRYPSVERPGLTNVSLVIRAGERIGIVGSTGSGKTTLANIILGLIAPTGGQFAVDGQPVLHKNVRAWQQAIGYVPQDIFLTDSTVRENIAFGLPRDQIDEARVLEAARIAQIHNFIMEELQDGYDTIVGERGIRLSGGQRQRIGIARALYTQADLVLFDEATSALDNATEKEVMRAIEALQGNKTLVMIAHRLSTLTGCDRILVLKQGEIVGFDSWEALERDCPEFRDIAQRTTLTPQGKGIYDVHS